MEAGRLHSQSAVSPPPLDEDEDVTVAAGLEVGEDVVARGRSPRLTEAANVLGGSFDAELDLLEMQLTATQTTFTPQGSIRYRETRFTRSVSGEGQWSDSATFPRRRKLRRSLMTLWSEKELLDESAVLQVERMLKRITVTWDFNAFSFDRLTVGHNLPTLCVHLLTANGVLRGLNLDPLTAWKFFCLVEQGYHESNPYHNAVHAADVTQAIHCFIGEPFLREHLKPIEIMGSVVAAVCHDLDHPGRNEKFLIATRSHLAGMYNNSSVLENHHWRSAVALMAESGLSEELPPRVGRELETIVREMILATDISRQNEFLSSLRFRQENPENGGLDMTKAEARLFILQIAMKCADISNPCRSWNISRLWSYRACEEFFRQGDKERELGLPVTPFCDRFNISVAKVQSGFYRFVASPLFEEWNNVLQSPLSSVLINNLTTNQAKWDLIAQQESHSGGIMVESAASTSSSSAGTNSSSQRTDSRRESQDPPAPQTPHNRRASRSSFEEDDSSDPCSSFPYFPLNASDYLNSQQVEPFASSCYASEIRRHSLPTSDFGLYRGIGNYRAESLDEASDKADSKATSSHVPTHFRNQSSVVVSVRRQFSFGERRKRQNRPSVTRKDSTDGQSSIKRPSSPSITATVARPTTTAASAWQKRKVFAENGSSKNSSSNTLTSLTSNQNQHATNTRPSNLMAPLTPQFKVTFSFETDEDDTDFEISKMEDDENNIREEREEEIDKENNLSLLESYRSLQMQRRGSAPPSLLCVDANQAMRLNNANKSYTNLDNSKFYEEGKEDYCTGSNKFTTASSGNLHHMVRRSPFSQVSSRDNSPSSALRLKNKEHIRQRLDRAAVEAAAVQHQQQQRRGSSQGGFLNLNKELSEMMRRRGSLPVELDTEVEDWTNVVMRNRAVKKTPGGGTKIRPLSANVEFNASQHAHQRRRVWRRHKSGSCGGSGGAGGWGTRNSVDNPRYKIETEAEQFSFQNNDCYDFQRNDFVKTKTPQPDFQNFATAASSVDGGHSLQQKQNHLISANRESGSFEAGPSSLNFQPTLNNGNNNNENNNNNNSTEEEDEEDCDTNSSLSRRVSLPVELTLQI